VKCQSCSEGANICYDAWLYAPPEDYQSKLSFFPGIADAISRAKKVGRREAQAQIRHEIWRVAIDIQRAAGALRGQIT